MLAERTDDLAVTLGDHGVAADGAHRLGALVGDLHVHRHRPQGAERDRRPLHVPRRADRRADRQLPAAPLGRPGARHQGRGARPDAAAEPRACRSRRARTSTPTRGRTRRRWRTSRARRPRSPWSRRCGTAGASCSRSSSASAATSPRRSRSCSSSRSSTTRAGRSSGASPTAAAASGSATPTCSSRATSTATWDQYIDAFSEVVPRRMKGIWGTSYGFPGPIPVEPFKAYIRKNEYVADHYWSAYPEGHDDEIISAQRVAQALDDFQQRSAGLDPDAFAAAYRDAAHRRPARPVKREHRNRSGQAYGLTGADPDPRRRGRARCAAHLDTFGPRTPARWRGSRRRTSRAG